MGKSRDVNKAIAANLAYFMARPGALYRNANSLAVASKVSPNTVRNLMDPNKRPPYGEKPVGSPTLDKIEKIAVTLGCEVWELLHPDIEKARGDLFNKISSLPEFKQKAAEDFIEYLATQSDKADEVQHRQTVKRKAG